jgi:His-Xaa-Ser system radical SAM maturase HxsB
MYYLLPFKFEQLNDRYEILVNEVGDYLIEPSGTTYHIVNREIDQNEDLLKDLTANFFISETKIPVLIDNLASRYRTKKSFLDSFTSLHIFVLTLRCNQNCVYCQASSRDRNAARSDITYNDLDLAINLMFKSPSSAITMEFQGGEPTLAFDKLKYAVEKTEELNLKFEKHITYVLCTNCINLTFTQLSFLKEYHVLISTSLDGPEFLHNHNRGKINSYQNVVKGIHDAIEVLGHDRISALMTTSNESLNYPKEIVNAYRQNGFNEIFLRALNPYGLAKENQWNDYNQRFLKFYFEALDYIIDLNLKGIRFVENFATLFLKKMLTPFCIGFVDLQSPAGIINSVVVYNYDGYIYASDESRMLAENNDYTFRIGKLSDSYNNIFFSKKIGEIANIWSNESLAGCSDCAFQSYCGADPVRNYTTQGDSYGFRPKSFFCKRNKAIIKHLLLLIKNRPEVFKVFKNWIK